MIRDRINREVEIGNKNKSMARVILVSAIIVLLLGSTFFNMQKLTGVFKARTQRYLKDINSQIASDVDFRLNTYSNYLDQLASSIKNMDSSYLSDAFFYHKAHAFDFEKIMILKDDENDYWNYLTQDREVYFTQSTVGYFGKEKILFTSVIDEDRILLGVFESSKFEDSIRTVAFNGRCNNFIVDSNGKIILGLENSLNISQLFSGKIDIESIINNDNDNIIYVDTTDSTTNGNLILAYSVINYDWVLFSMIPKSMIYQGANSYISNNYSLFIAEGVIILILLFLSWVLETKSNKKLYELAYTDSVTKGINDYAFRKKCERVIQNNVPYTYTMIFLNIRSFKIINDNYGFDNGNRLLKHIYNVIGASLKNNEYVTRCEADHYFICMKESDVQIINKRVKDIINKLESYNVVLKAGAYVIDNHKLNIRSIKDRARLAYKYVNELDFIAYYDYDLASLTVFNSKLLLSFDEAIKKHDFKIFFQPKIDINTKQIYGAETLVRWMHPTLGMIYPEQFISLFEQDNKIIKLDNYIFENLCQIIARWKENNIKVMPVSFNISRVHLNDENFVNDLVDIKNRYNIDDGILEIELTESIFIDFDRLDVLKDALCKLHDNGFMCSLDDFGCGYSSLSLLRSFDIDIIKLDKVFFKDLSEKSKKIISALIALAKSIGVLTVAEGIETNKQYEFLKMANCDLIQGYLFSRPLSVDDFEKWCVDYHPKEDENA